VAARPQPKPSKADEPVTPPQILEPPVSLPVEEIPLEETEPVRVPEKEAAVGQIANIGPAEGVGLSHTADVPPPVLPSLYVPLAEAEDREHPPQQITIILRPSHDKEIDKRRIKTIYGTLISYHGRDKFTFQIFENGRGHLIDFPNDTTRICPELLARLKKVVGDESWRIEPILLQ
jgi:hypothetical protein